MKASGKMSATPDLGFTQNKLGKRPVSGLGPRSSSRKNGAPEKSDAAGGNAKAEDALPSAREGRGHFARMKVAEIKSRLSDMDKDLETQALVRRQRDMKVERVMSDVSQVEPALNNMNQKIVDINDTVRGVKRDLQLQMDSQATMRKELMVVLEEKTKGIKTSLATDIDILKERAGELGARLRKLEDAQTGGGEMEEMKERVNTIDNYNSRVGERLAELNCSLEGEKSERLADMDANNKRIQQQLSHTAAQVDAERQARERDSRRIEDALHASVDEGQSALQRCRQELERALDLQSTNLREGFADAKAMLDAENRKRTEDETALSRKITEGLFDMQNSFNDQLQNRDHEMSKAVRVLEDKIQMVSQGVERDREHNHVAIKKVQEDLNREREQREEFEESIMRLVEDQLSKLHVGIEKHPGAGHAESY